MSNRVEINWFRVSHVKRSKKVDVGAFKVPRSNSASLQKIKNAVISFLLKAGVIEKSYCLIEETERVPDSHLLASIWIS